MLMISDGWSKYTISCTELFTIISTGLVASDAESGTRSIIQTSYFVELLESRPCTRRPKVDASTSESTFDRDELLNRGHVIVLSTFGAETKISL